MGRNGLFDITAVEVSELPFGGVAIGGIGKRGLIINGGLRVSAKAMDELAEKWLVMRLVQRHVHRVGLKLKKGG